MLVNDLNGDGKLEVARRYTDLHNGRDAEFRIYEVRLLPGKAVLGGELARVQTDGDYCQGIEWRDVDGDGQNELLFTTLGRDALRRGLHIVRCTRENGAFVVLKPDRPMGTLAATFSFTAASTNNAAELAVVSATASDSTVFSPVAPVAGQTPQYWLRQVYRIGSFALEQSESAMLETPYYVLSRMLGAMQKKDMFAAYKYMFSETPYHNFRSETLAAYPHLCARQAAGHFILVEWGLEFYRDYRNIGWLTFSHVFEENGRERRMLYQAFMRKVYDEWKITLLRKIQET